MTISKVFTAENSSGSLKYWQYIYLYGFDDDEEKIGNLYLGMAEDWRMNTFKNPNGTEDDQQLRPYQIYHGPIKTEVGYVQSLDLSIDPEFVFAIKTSTLDDTYNFENVDGSEWLRTFNAKDGDDFVKFEYSQFQDLDFINTETVFLVEVQASDLDFINTEDVYITGLQASDLNISNSVYVDITDIQANNIIIEDDEIEVRDPDSGVPFVGILRTKLNDLNIQNKEGLIFEDVQANIINAERELKTENSSFAQLQNIQASKLNLSNYHNVYFNGQIDEVIIQGSDMVFVERDKTSIKKLSLDSNTTRTLQQEGEIINIDTFNAILEANGDEEIYFEIEGIQSNTINIEKSGDSSGNSNRYIFDNIEADELELKSTSHQTRLNDSTIKILKLIGDGEHSSFIYDSTIDTIELDNKDSSYFETHSIQSQELSIKASGDENRTFIQDSIIDDIQIESVSQSLEYGMYRSKTKNINIDLSSRDDLGTSTNYMDLYQNEIDGDLNIYADPNTINIITAEDQKFNQLNLEGDQLTERDFFVLSVNKSQGEIYLPSAPFANINLVAVEDALPEDIAVIHGVTSDDFVFLYAPTSLYSDIDNSVGYRGFENSYVFALDLNKIVNSTQPTEKYVPYTKYYNQETSPYNEAGLLVGLTDTTSEATKYAGFIVDYMLNLDLGNFDLKKSGKSFEEWIDNADLTSDSFLNDGSQVSETDGSYILSFDDKDLFEIEGDFILDNNNRTLTLSENIRPLTGEEWFINNFDVGIDQITINLDEENAGFVNEAKIDAPFSEFELNASGLQFIQGEDYGYRFLGNISREEFAGILDFGNDLKLDLKIKDDSIDMKDFVLDVIPDFGTNSLNAKFGKKGNILVQDLRVSYIKDYNSAIEHALVLQGSVKFNNKPLGEFFLDEVTLNLGSETNFDGSKRPQASSEGVIFSSRGIDVVGVFQASNEDDEARENKDSTGGKFGIDEVEIDVDTIEEEYKGTLALSLPFLNEPLRKSKQVGDDDVTLTIEADFIGDQADPFKLKKISAEGTNLGIPIPKLLSTLDTIKVSADDIDLEDEWLTPSVGIGMYLGNKKISKPFIDQITSMLDLDVEIQVNKLLQFNGELELDFVKEELEGKIDLTLINEEIARWEGEGLINWSDKDKDFLKADVKGSFLGGLFTFQDKFELDDDLNFNIKVERKIDPKELLKKFGVSDSIANNQPVAQVIATAEISNTGIKAYAEVDIGVTDLKIGGEYRFESEDKSKAINLNYGQKVPLTPSTLELIGSEETSQLTLRPPSRDSSLNLKPLNTNSGNPDLNQNLEPIPNKTNIKVSSDSDLEYILLEANWSQSTSKLPGFSIVFNDNKLSSQEELDSIQATVVALLSTSNKLVVALPTPQEGEYSLQLSNDNEVGDVTYTNYLPDQSPEASVHSLILDQENNKILIEYSVVDDTEGVTTNFFASKNGTFDDRIFLGKTQLDSQNEPYQVDLNYFQGEGNYYFAAEVFDGINNPIYALSNQKLSVADDSALIIDSSTGNQINPGNFIDTSTPEPTTIISLKSYKLGPDEDNLILTGSEAINGTGNSLDNNIVGNNAMNVINGKGGADRMLGKDDDDTYYVNNKNDKVIETADQGIDTVRSSISYTLNNNVENLKLLGSQANNGTGNVLDNKITGNNAKNVIDGKGGADEMAGKKGDDIYTVNNKNDTVIELANQGIDKVRSYIDYSLSGNVEDLKLLGSKAIDGTGNKLNNKITGNSAKNIIDGKKGADEMAGKKGKDIYYVDNKNDKVIEVANQGTDTVRSSVTETLSSNVENLELKGSKAINGKGNALNNKITGNNNKNNLKGLNGKDEIYGRGGKDVLTGGAKADQFIYKSITDSGTTGTSRDVITDFSSIDKINLAKIDADQGTGGNQELVFIGSDSFSGAGQVRFNDGLLSVNTDDDLKADMQIKLSGVVALDETSLIL